MYIKREGENITCTPTYIHNATPSATQLRQPCDSAIDLVAITAILPRRVL